MEHLWSPFIDRLHISDNVAHTPGMIDQNEPQCEMGDKNLKIFK